MFTVLLMALLGAELSGFSDHSLTGITAYADETEKIPVKVLILPKFEIDDIESDFPGEAQSEYCTNCSFLLQRTKWCWAAAYRLRKNSCRSVIDVIAFLGCL